MQCPDSSGKCFCVPDDFVAPFVLRSVSVDLECEIIVKDPALHVLFVSSSKFFIDRRGGGGEGPLLFIPQCPDGTSKIPRRSSWSVGLAGPADPLAPSIPTDMSREQQYWLPGYGLSRHIVLGHIHYFLGPSASVRPYSYQVYQTRPPRGAPRLTGSNQMF